MGLSLRFLRKKQNISIVVCGVIVFCFLGCREAKVKKSTSLMGTFVEITVWDKDKLNADKAIKSAFGEIKKIEQIANIFKQESEICVLNRQGQAKLSPQLYSLLKQSCRVGGLTGGAFDITIAPLSVLWKEKIAKQKVPDKEDIFSLQELVNYKNIVFEDNNQVYFKKEGMAVDLGGIAKGYAVDCAVRVLKEYRIKDALINAGGDVFVLGKDKDEKWSIALQHPRLKEEILGTLNLENKAIFTSGDYERFFEKKGIRYHHIIDPRTGSPAVECISVTIIADNSAVADGLATGILVLDSGEGMKLIEDLPDVEAVIIDNTGKVFISSGLKKYDIYQKIR
ncbi:FAD:protein FMN transferase [bacterium]|nr:FAD:protein FMN transferase [bacterium]